ncbi:MAG: hypothetical protein M1831_000275 [Alyxoria varia]|nr:MAG: hypothetical protein M1831_000275 [Alyxoria varia]
MWKRIHQTGVRSVMGVPGDFNLNFLDYIYEIQGDSDGQAGLTWIGNSNELNAAYAADGYARAREGDGTPGCIVTTHGVGELSALNGIAGASCESSAVIHVVGQTGRAMQEDHMMIHHSIGLRPDHQLYNKVSSHIRHTAAELWDPQKAPAEIDRVIHECIISRQPVCIYFPIDLTDAKVDPNPLNTPIDLEPPTDTTNQAAAISAIVSALEAAKNPAILVDHQAKVFAPSPARRLVAHLRIPTYAAPMGKGCVDEDDPNYVGIYNSHTSFEGVREGYEAADLVLALGWWPSNLNTLFFSRGPPPEKRIDLMSDSAVVKCAQYENVYIAQLISRLIESIEPSKIAHPSRPKVGGVPDDVPAPPPPLDPEQITQAWVWPRLGKALFRKNDQILADVGTATSGIQDVTFPRGSNLFCQYYWGSIGFTCPAALGAEVARKDMGRIGRTVLVIGDGSLMLTLQEVGNMVAKGLGILIVIINNGGYTIERAIHGPEMSYNDIPSTSYSHLLPLFGVDVETAKQRYRRASTKSELDEAMGWVEDMTPSLAKTQHTAEKQLPLVLEVVMGKMDLPWRLREALRFRKERGA